MIDSKRDFIINGLELMNFINLSEDEKEIVRKWRNQPNIRKQMYSAHIISRKEHKEFINGLVKDSRNVYWLIKEKDKEYLGVIYLNRLDLRNKNAYLGIYSNCCCKSSGTGRLIIGCLIKLAFKILHLHSLKLEVIETNERALTFYKKSGFKKEGKLKEFVCKNDEWRDVIIMGMLDRDYNE